MSQPTEAAGRGKATIAFFRNDDINDLTPELKSVTKLLIDEGIPIIHAVEPGNVTDECTAWLLEQQDRHGRLLQIMQHGYNHTQHSKGEFGGGRSYQEQYDDLKRGREIMNERFGEQWYPAVNFPYGPYNQDTIRAVEELGFKIFNGHFNPRFSRRMFYALGRMLGRGQILDKHISYHLGIYPSTNMFTVDMAISYINNYYGDYGSKDCDWHAREFLINRHNEARRYINVIGWLLHHRYHNDEESLRLVLDTIAEMRRQDPDIEFWNFAEIYDAYAAQAFATVS
jgi:hypothetical protein